VGLPLYCSPNLEKYIEGLKGCDNMAEAIAGAGKCEKKPDDLKGYNDRLMQSFRNLADVSEGM